MLQRFIPIHTGNSPHPPHTLRRYSVHPHTHGELIHHFADCLALVGSSPYTRGTREISGLDGKIIRFIPIHTGNSETAITSR
ncbi:hypothetical protein Mhun_1368 [Methanospirillum hungatei JF-1]|nr:hypothetical protein Mhun_1368 [Methanospirillum hungatei JF-1]